MRRLVIALVCFLLLGPAAAAELSPAMRSLCQRAERAAFVPLQAPRPASDPLFQALAGSADERVLSAALAGGDPDAPRGSTGMTPLSFAAASANVTGIRLLLARGAQIDRAGQKGMPPLAYALTAGHPGIACLLVQWGAKVPSAGAMPFLLPAAALAEGDPAGAATLVAFLAEQGHDLNARMQGDTALIIAAESGNLPLVRLLLDKGARTDLRNKQQETAEAVARRSGYPEIAGLIRQARATRR